MRRHVSRGCPFALFALLCTLATLVLRAQVPRTGTFLLKIGGQRLHCQRNGQGPDLVLLHGGLSSSEDFAPVRASLEQSFTVLLYDRAGHGRSTDGGEPFHYATMAEEAMAVLDALAISRVAVLGWSDGGVIGYHLASRWPARITRLVAIGANVNVSGLGPETCAWLGRSRSAEALLADLPDVAKTYLSISPNPDRLLTFLTRSRELWLRDPYLSFEELDRIQAPVLLVVGDRRDVTLSHILQIRAAIKDASLCVLPGASHFVLGERPHLLLPILLDFLGRK